MKPKTIDVFTFFLDFLELDHSSKPMRVLQSVDNFSD